MKKLVFVFAVAFAASMVSCGGSEKAAETAEDTTAAVETEVVEENVDTTAAADTTAAEAAADTTAVAE